MTDTIENMNKSISLKLAEMLDDLRAETIVREARLMYTVVEINEIELKVAA